MSENEKNMSGSLLEIDYTRPVCASQDLGLEAGQSVVVRCENRLVRIVRFMGSIQLIDLSNAGRRGKECAKLIVSENFALTDDQNEERLEWCVATALLYLLEGLPEEGVSLDDLKVSRRSVKSFSVWPHESQFASVFKPLKAIPNKWTLPHVIRALVAGQIRDCRRDYRYTDDYYADAKDNYGKCSMDPVELARKLNDSPSGWRAVERDGRVEVACHHFELNSFEFDLDARRKSDAEEVQIDSSAAPANRTVTLRLVAESAPSGSSDQSELFDFFGRADSRARLDGVSEAR